MSHFCYFFSLRSTTTLVSPTVFMKNAIKVVRTKTQFSSWKAKIVQKIPQYEYEKALEPHQMNLRMYYS